MLIRRLAAIVPAEGVILERVPDVTYPIWNGGRTRQAYGKLDCLLRRGRQRAWHLCSIALTVARRTANDGCMRREDLLATRTLCCS